MSDLDLDALTVADALAKYGNHAANCSAHEDVMHPCNCGWSAALKEPR